MEILVKRIDCNQYRTIGKLEMPDFSCFTLEDPVRQEKIAGKTAIPSGRYEVVVSYSNRFQKMLPLLLEVENFTGVRIHSGNSAADTEGCILIGTNRSIDSITESRRAMASFMPKLMNALKKEKVFIVME